LTANLDCRRRWSPEFIPSPSPLESGIYSVGGGMNSGLQRRRRRRRRDGI